MSQCDTGLKWVNGYIGLCIAIGQQEKCFLSISQWNYKCQSIRKKDPRHDDRTAVHKTRLSLAWLYCLPSQDMYTPSLLKVH